MVTYSHELAMQLNVTAVILCLATIILRRSLARALGLLAYSVIPGVLAAIGTGIAVALLGNSLGVVMSWHTDLIRTIPLFGLPTLMVALVVRVGHASADAAEHWPSALLDELSAATALWCILLGAMTACSHTTASYLLLVWVGPPLGLAVLASAVGARFGVLASTLVGSALGSVLWTQARAFHQHADGAARPVLAVRRGRRAPAGTTTPPMLRVTLARLPRGARAVG